MTRDTYPIQLLVQGRVKAYSPDQIRDNLEKDFDDVLGALFHVDHLAYQVKIGEQELMFTGMKKEELVEALARRIYGDRREFCEAILDHLALIAELLESESGIIFVHKGTKRAVNVVQKAKESLERYLTPFEKLSVEDRAAFCKTAETILEQTIWWNSSTNLLKEG